MSPREFAMLIGSRWHRWVLGHRYVGVMNSGDGPPRVGCSCGTVWSY